VADLTMKRWQLWKTP